ncbi:MAG TPA: hypothetical protein PKX93_06720 [bacterium]|nr:hypothetical protein [bacterium]HPP13285.1 hypothetical protein [bacterium]
MEDIVRYRVRNKFYLCLSPEEAMLTGVTTGEQVIERVILRKNPGWTCHEFATLRTDPLEELAKIDALQRHEQIFSSRREAQQFMASQPEGQYVLCGIVETQTVPREEIHPEKEPPVEDILRQLSSFDKKETHSS